MSDTPDWKSDFYARYVSSGQAPDSGTTSAEVLFKPREQYQKNIIARHVPTDRSQRIIDLGCGPGTLLYFLGQAGYRDIAGVDLSAEQIATAQRLGISTATCATLEDFLEAQPTGSVDVVFAIDIFEHLTRPHLMEVLASIRRVLKPGGRCVAHVPNAEGLFGMAIRFGDFTHELAFTRVSANQIFRVAGFSAVRCFEDKPHVHGLKSFVRSILWTLGTLPSRMLLLAETGSSGHILSQNLMIEAIA